jgi:EAL domain-containing protein (putative c-di-GMP-specific phosphodiesterase class I)
MATAALEGSMVRPESGFKMYSQALQADAMEYMAIETGLREALQKDQLKLNFQPQIDAVTGQVIGAEALLRWTADSGLVVSPAKFIPVAEESGLILPIGSWVMETACRYAVSWYHDTGSYLPVGVNVSAKQFGDPDFVDHIDRVLTETGLPPEFLEIEITEGTFIEDPQKTVEILTDLKVRGLRIALDDFGTGYSSLSYLKKFPIDRLKVDRSFVMDIADDEDDKAIVSLISDISRNLGMEVIAEGVEDTRQREVLMSMGCSAMQGFYYSKPLEAGAFLSFLKLNA